MAQDSFKWLDQKRNQLAKALKQLEREPFIETPLASLEEIESLLNPTGQLANENIQIVKDKLITEALKNDTVVPECYRQKITAQLFEQVCEHFVWEIKYNSIVHNIFNVQLLAQINAQLTEQKLAIQNIVNSQTVPSPNRADATAKITLEIELDDLSTPQLSSIIEDLQKHGIKVRRIEDGSVVLVLEGSQQEIEQLETLFQSGQLTEISGIPIKKMHIEPTRLPAKTLVSLSQWLPENLGAAIKAAGWQTLEEIFGTRQLAFRQNKAVKRAKQIYLGAKQTVILVVELTPTENQAMDILLRVYSIDDKTDLPENLKLTLLSESGEPLEEVQADNHQDCIEQPLTGTSGERFCVNLTLDDVSVTEDFII